ncbi:MAG: bacteriocin-protection protein [Acidobacteria bacterium]|nr:bacteriocin-protection protein [Acidobacteriota bacterium]
MNNLPTDFEIVLFASQPEWRKWLAKQHAKAPGLWLRFAKKNSGVVSVTYDEALDVALCYGWIDGLKKKYDEQTYMLRFTPRGARSVWSKINRNKATALIESNQMQPAGHAAIERAQQNGQWDAAYDGQSTMEVPDDLQAALNKNAKAKKFFAELNSVNRYAILFRLQTAVKAETRAKRLRQFIEMLERQEKIHS